LIVKIVLKNYKVRKGDDTPLYLRLIHRKRAQKSPQHGQIQVHASPVQIKLQEVVPFG
jgi:hypothetical protein